MKEIVEAPALPYLMKSGKHSGEYLEELMFKNPEYVNILDVYLRKGKPNNSLQHHLDLLLGSMPQTVTVCPICKKERVKYFLYLNLENVSERLTCCDNPDCKQTLKSNYYNDYLLPLKLRSTFSLGNKALRRRYLTMLKKVTGLPVRPRAREVFKVFIGEPLPRPSEEKISQQSLF